MSIGYTCWLLFVHSFVIWPAFAVVLLLVFYSLFFNYVLFASLQWVWVVFCMCFIFCGVGVGLFGTLWWVFIHHVGNWWWHFFNSTGSQSHWLLESLALRIFKNLWLWEPLTLGTNNLGNQYSMGVIIIWTRVHPKLLVVSLSPSIWQWGLQW